MWPKNNYVETYSPSNAAAQHPEERALYNKSQRNIILKKNKVGEQSD